MCECEECRLSNPKITIPTIEFAERVAYYRAIAEMAMELQRIAERFGKEEIERYIIKE